MLLYVADDSVLNFRVLASGKGGVMAAGLPAGVGVLRGIAGDLEAGKGGVLKSKKVEGVRVRVCGVCRGDSLEWLVVRVSAEIGFAVAGVRYYMEERKRVKRKAVQELELRPVFSDVGGV